MLAIAAGYGLKKVATGLGNYEMEVANIDFDLFTDDTLNGKWEKTPEDPLVVLFVHSDCEGTIDPDLAGPIADRLQSLDIPHDQKETTDTFIKGLRQAASLGETVEFL